MRHWRPNADPHLRSAEITARVSGSPEDVARWLWRRPRAGNINPERIAMAAYLGHPAAQLLDLPLRAFGAAEHVSMGCRLQPSNVGKGVVDYSLGAFRQAVFGRGRNQNDVPRPVLEAGNAARDSERDWQDAHFANALLAEEWPGVPL